MRRVKKNARTTLLMVRLALVMLLLSSFLHQPKSRELKNVSQLSCIVRNILFFFFCIHSRKKKKKAERARRKRTQADSVLFIVLFAFRSVLLGITLLLTLSSFYFIFDSFHFAAVVVVV